MQWGLAFARGSAPWRVRCAFIALFSSLFFPSQGARAQTVLFPTSADSPAVVARFEAEIPAILRAALAEQGESLRAAADIAAESGTPLEEPCDLACIERVLELAGAERGLMVQLATSGGSLASVTVVALDRAGFEVAGEASAIDRPFSDALRAALEGALERWPARAGVLVEVVGSPAGASVLVDRTPFGTIPARGRLGLGTHHLVVAAAGHETVRRAFEVTVRDRLELRIDLDRAGRAVRSGEGRAWIVGPVVLGAAGTGLLAFAGVALARGGCELEAGDGTCVRGTRVDPLPFGLTVAGGAAALATGLVWIPLGKRRERSETAVGLAPTGVTLRASFRSVEGE